MIHVPAGVMVWAFLAMAAALPAMGQAGNAAPDPNARDHFIGSYALPARVHRSLRVIPGRDTLIQVLKRDGIYYMLYGPVEVPLKECPGGLEWDWKRPGMAGTKITFDQAGGATSSLSSIRRERKAASTP